MNTEQIISILDIAFIVLAVLGCLIGFCRGIFKSTYNFIIFIVLLMLGWALSSSFLDKILDTEINATVGEVTITTIRETIITEISKSDPGLGSLFVEGSETYAVTMGLLNMIAKIIFMIIWLVLMFTVFKIITAIIYSIINHCIIRPKRVDENGKVKKKGLISRFVGAGIGAIHMAVIVLVICIPVSGVFSIGSSISETMNTENLYSAVPTSDGKIVLLSSEVPIAEPPISIAENDNIFSAYRNSKIGKLYETIKLGDEAIDEKLFDSIFEFEYNSTKIALKSELTIIIKTYNSLQEETEGKITLDNILNLESEYLYSLIDDISNLKLISVCIPVATEFLFNSDKVAEKLGDVLGEVDAKSLIENVKGINYKNEFQNFGKGLIDINKSGLLKALKEKDEDGKSLSLFKVLAKVNDSELNNALQKISDAELMEIFGDLGLGYLVKSNAFSKYLEHAELTTADINLENISFSNEISSLGSVISKIKALELEKQEKIDITAIPDQKINEFVDALYEMKLFSTNTKLVVSVIREELLTDDYKVILPNKEMTKDDLKSSIKVAKVLLKAAESSESGKIDINNVLSAENIAILKEEGENSEFLREVINGAGQVLINELCKNFGLEKDKINLENVTWLDELDTFKELSSVCSSLGIDFNNLSGTKIEIKNLTDEDINKFANAVFDSNVMKNNTELMLTMIKKYAGNSLENYIPTSLANSTELVSFLKLARTMVASSEGGKIDPSTLNKEELGSALEGMSEENINNLLTGIVESSGLLSKENINLPKIDPTTDEGKEEIKKTLEAIDTLSEITDIQSFKNLDDNAVSSITGSSVATNVVVSLLTEKTKEGGELAGIISLDGISDDEWIDKDGEKGELKKLLDATSVLLDENGETNITSDKILNLSDEDITTLTDSKVVVNSLQENINNVIDNTINESFDKEALGFEINLGEVVVGEGQNQNEVWAQELTTIRDVANMSSDLSPETTDLSDEATANKIGNLIESSKNSQILGDTSLAIAEALLKDGYSSVEGQEAPEVTSETDFVAEFLKLQGLLK